MKLSIVIICWNDLKVIKDCLESVYRETPRHQFRGDCFRQRVDGRIGRATFATHFPSVRIVENGANLGFARGNNAGIAVATGEYVLILNPDTIIRDRALIKLVAYADEHPEGGAFGCRVLNPDGSFQNPARPLPTCFGRLIAALDLRWLGKLSSLFESDLYYGWDGHTERAVGFQSGCCVMVRRKMLEQLRGFDERFFYHFEETDLCCRVWKAGSKSDVLPRRRDHSPRRPVGGQVSRSALRSRHTAAAIATSTSTSAAQASTQVRWLSLLDLGIRHLGYSLTAACRIQRGAGERLEDVPRADRLELAAGSARIHRQLARSRISDTRRLRPRRGCASSSSVGPCACRFRAPIAPAGLLTSRPRSSCY